VIGGYVSKCEKIIQNAQKPALALTQTQKTEFTKEKNSRAIANFVQTDEKDGPKRVICC